MKAELMKRLFKAIFSEDIVSLKKIAQTIIGEERELGHNKLANSLERISVTEKPRFGQHKPTISTGLASLPTNKRDNSQLVSFVPREMLKHHMILPANVEERLQSIEREYAAKERLGKYNLSPKKKILLHGAPGCGKTMSAERIAWNLGEIVSKRYAKGRFYGKIEQKGTKGRKWDGIYFRDRQESVLDKQLGRCNR